MVENKFIEGYTSAFQNAMRDIESLKEFYKRSSRTVVEYRVKLESECKEGKIISDLFDSVLRLSTTEERNNRLKEINEIEIADGVKLSDICIVEPFQEGKKSLSYTMTDQYMEKESFFPENAGRKYESIQKYENILIESVLSHGIVIYESYLEHIYKILLWENPLKHFEGQTILLADVFKEDFTEKIREKVDKEVESKMYDALKTTELICEKEGLVIERYGKFLAEFTEVYLRRNAYVHTNGKANKKYIRGVAPKYKASVKENEKLVCDDIYIRNLFCILTKIIFSITYELLSTRSADEDVMHRIAAYFFERLKEGEYETSKFVYLSLSQYKSLQFVDRTMFRINYINAAKQLGESGLVDAELQKLDVSIATDNFKIAKECLLNNNHTVFEMLKNSYPQSFNATAIREWPIFINFRESEYYAEFVAMHPSDFDVKEIEIDDIVDFEEDELNNNSELLSAVSN